MRVFLGCYPTSTSCQEFLPLLFSTILLELFYCCAIQKYTVPWSSTLFKFSPNPIPSQPVIFGLSPRALRSFHTPNPVFKKPCFDTRALNNTLVDSPLCANRSMLRVDSMGIACATISGPELGLRGDRQVTSSLTAPLSNNLEVSAL